METHRQGDIRDRTRAAVALVNSTNDEDFALEAFMGLFHPEIQRDRAAMRELKGGRHKRGQR